MALAPLLLVEPWLPTCSCAAHVPQHPTWPPASAPSFNLQVPVFFVVTKIDLAPEHVMKHTLQTLSGLLKKPGVR